MKIRAAELHLRSIAKAISYRLIHITIDSLVAYFFTRSIPLSIGIVVFVNTYSTVVYYLHERVWAHISWGRRVAVLNGSSGRP